MGVFDPAMLRRAFACLSGTVLARSATGAMSGAAPPPRRTPASGAVPANVRVTEDIFAAHIEPALAVNPRDPRNLLAACRVFTGAQIGMAAYASFDGGGTWRGRGLLPGLVSDFCGNATVAFDDHGRGFVCGVVTMTGQSRHGDARVWRTDDGGRSFHPPVTAITGGAGLVDHPWLAIGRAAHTSPARLYVAARMYGTANDGLVLARSLDGGRTFKQPRELDPATGASAASPVIAAGPDGMLSAVYVAPSSSDGLALRAVSSSDQGESFTAPVDVAQVTSMAPSLGDVTAKSGPAIAAAPGSSRTYAAVTGYDDRTGTSRLLLTAFTAQAHAWTPPMTVAASDETVYLQPPACRRG